MKLPPFRLHRPTSVAEAGELAMTHGSDALFLGGGTELVLLMKLGLATPAHIIDLKAVPGLDAVDSIDGHLQVGALVTHRQIEQHATVRDRLPEFARVSSIIANRRVRGSGTLAGNLCFADPHSDPATLLTALEAAVVIARPEGGSRYCPLTEFWVGPYATSLAVGEFVTAVRVPMSSRVRVAHERFKLKERPAVTVSVVLGFDRDRIVSARVAAGSVEPVPRRLPAVEYLLLENRVDTTHDLAETAAGEVDPIEDQDGSPEYKRHLVGVLTARAVERVLHEQDERIRE